MDFGNYALETLRVVIPGALTLALGAFLVWAAAALFKRFRAKQPDFILRSRGGTMWELERTGRKTAFVVTQGDGIVAGSHFGQMLSGGLVGDMVPGQRMTISLPNDTGCYVWYHWVSGDMRRYTKSVYVDPSTTEASFVGIAGKLNEPFQT